MKILCETSKIAKKLQESISKGAAFSSAGRKLRPDPKTYAVREDVWQKVGGLDPDYENDAVQIADLAARIQEAGYETDVISEIPMEPSKDGVDGNLFIKKRRYALPAVEPLSEILMDTVPEVGGSVLVVADEVPCAIDRIEADELVLITSDIAGAKAAQILLNARWAAESVVEYTEEDKKYDWIVVFPSISSVAGYREVIMKLHFLLKPQGKLVVQEENPIGFHRLGTALTNAYRGIPPIFKERDLAALKLHGVIKPIYDLRDNEEYAPLYEQLYAMYGGSSLRNSLYLHTTVFIIDAEG